MKKILFGVCGLGNGHVIRETSVLRLISKKNDVLVAATKNTAVMLKQQLPDIKTVEIFVPWVSCNNQGIDFKDTLIRYDDTGIDWYKTMLKVFIQIEEILGGTADIVFTDYEMITAQYAYARQLPLVTIDQQSKFLGFSFQGVDGYRQQEEYSRLKYFFPAADRRYVTSFYPLEDAREEKVEVLPPVIKPTIHARADRRITNKAILYLSPFCQDRARYLKLIELCKNTSNYQFDVFTREYFPEYIDSNLSFHPFGAEFDTAIQEADFVVSTAGHQLISEALYLNLPLFVVPLDTYDQHICAKMIRKYCLGASFRTFEELPDNLNHFISELEVYKRNICDYKANYWHNKWAIQLADSLRTNFQIDC